jgi:4-hydroxy-tetrahydrodipicolinate synthase
MHEMCRRAVEGDAAGAREVNNKLIGLHRHLFCEANPIPVKWAVQQLGRISGGIRLPLTPLSSAYQNQVRDAMRQAGLA